MSFGRLGIGLGIIPHRARPVATTQPVNEVPPSITGIFTQGQTLTADPGQWTGLPSSDFAYQWQRNGTNISGATNSTYVPTADDVSAGASAITVEVTGTNDLGATMAESAGVTIAATLSITGSPPDGGVGAAYSWTPTTEGGHAPYSYALTGTLPAGLSFNTSTGAITGTPLSSGTAGGLDVTVTDADGLTDSLGAFDIAIAADATPAPFDTVLGATEGAKAGALNGWAGRHSSQPTISSPVAFDVDSPGYDETGAATTLRRRLYVTAPIYEPWNNQATQSALDAAVSELIYADDTLFGTVENTSTVAYPKVIARWVTVPKQVLGAGLPIEVLAFQLFGRMRLPVRACKITGTPTTGPAVTKTTTYAKSTLYADGLPTWQASFADSDFPSNGNAAVTFTFEAFGWIGDAASVRDTSGATFPSASTLSPIVMQTVGGTVRYAYVDNVLGNDGTGVVSSTAATASASSYLTLTAAMTGAFAAASNASFMVIRCKNTGLAYTWDNTAPTGATRTAPDHWFTIEGDPADADPYNNIVIQTSTTTYKQIFNNGAGTFAWLRFQNIGITIAAGFQGLWSGASGRGLLWLHHVKFVNNLTANTTWCSGVFGVFVTQSDGQAANASARTFSVSSSNLRIWLVRATTSNRRVDGNVVCSTTIDASTITNQAVGLGEGTQLATSNLIAHNVKILNWAGTNSPVFIVADDGSTMRDVAMVQVDLLCANGATNPCMVFGENLALDYVNIYLDYITVRGGTDAEAGRINIHNDPPTNPTTAVSDQCVYTNFALRRSLTKWVAIKDDVFHGVNEGDTGAGLLVMGWVKRYGVNFALNNSAYSPDNFAPNHFGYGSTRAVAVTYDGSGRPTAGAPLIPDETWQALTWDIDGVARRIDGTGVTGCREAA